MSCLNLFSLTSLKYFTDYTASEHYLFDHLPFNVATMEGQDKMEDIFDALNIDLNQKPYFPHFAFFLCLAVIKRNNYDETKDQVQLRHFIKCVKYLKLHYKSLIKTALISGNEEDVKIPLSFGLYRGPRMEADEPTQEFAEIFLNNFFDDLNYYLKRAPTTRKALLKYL